MITDDIIQFGGYAWRVLITADNKALIISDKIIVKQEYGITSSWKDCDLRVFLNRSFYDNKFTKQEKVQIIETQIKTGDSYTEDKVFILSVQEIIQYFGDSGQLARGNKYIDDEYNQARIAIDKESNKVSWWFLRTSYDPDNLAMCVSDDGGIYVSGHGITVKKAGIGGVRPVLWLSI